MDRRTGPLLAADETFTHQVVETFATVGQTDHGWTEKVAAQAAATDGSLQLDFGIGKYSNRGVLDAFAGVSRGAEQWTVRASRELHRDPESTSVGPIHYEVLEPYETVRFRLEPNDVQPIAFEWTFQAEIPAVLEEREHRRSRDGARVEENLLRYHQIGTASGWVEVDGEQTAFDRETWFSTRDHSWGVRANVGRPPEDLAPRTEPPGLRVLVVWSPMLLRRDDGSHYGIHHYQHRIDLPDVFERIRFQGGVEHPDGRREAFAACVPDLRFEPGTRRLRGGTLSFRTPDGDERPVTIEALGDTGFHLGTGLYFGWQDHHHGEWRGKLHVDGEHLPDCRAVAREVHQLRDAVVRVDDPVGGGAGWGNVQTIITGPWPDLGLTDEDSFI